MTGRESPFPRTIIRHNNQYNINYLIPTCKPGLFLNTDRSGKGHLSLSGLRVRYFLELKNWKGKKMKRKEKRDDLKL